MRLRLAGRLDNCRMVGVVYEGAATKHRNSSDIDLLCGATHFGLFVLARRKEALKSMKRINIFLQTILLLLPILVLPAKSQDKVGSAVETVKAFYKLHFARGDRMYFEPQNIDLKRSWFTDRLYKLMLYEFQRAREYEKAHPEYAPIKQYFDGDVFTDCQSPADAFRVTRGTEKGDKAEVTVWAYWNNDAVGKMKRKIQVVLIKVGDKWLIDNLIYEEGESFVDQLRRPSYY